MQRLGFWNQLRNTFGQILPRGQRRKAAGKPRTRSHRFEPLEARALLSIQTVAPLSRLSLQDSSEVVALYTAPPRSPVAQPIPTQTIVEGQYFAFLDLRPYFSLPGQKVEESATDSLVDAKSDTLTFSIRRNSNPSLVRSAEIDKWLNWAAFAELVPGATGTATITVRATSSAGLCADATWTIEVQPKPEKPKPDNREPDLPERDNPESSGSYGIVVESGTLTVHSVSALAPGGSLSIGSGGTLVLGGGAPLGQPSGQGDTIGTLGVTISGGTVRIGPDAITGNIGLAGGTLVFDGDTDGTFSYGIDNCDEGTGTVTKAGKATITFDGECAYTGGTVIEAGILAFSSSATLPDSGDILIETSGTLSTAGPTACDTAAEWLASGRIDVGSTGTLALAASESGNIDMGDMGAGNYAYPSLYLGALSSETYGGTLTPEDTTYLLGGGPGTLTVSSALTGSRSVSVRGDVVLTSTSNTYSSGTTITAGMLLIASGALSSNTANGSILIDDHGALKAAGAYSNATNWLGSNKISDSSDGALALVATESVDLTGYSTLYLGAAEDLTFSSTLTPAGQNYRLGGGPGALTISANLGNVNQQATNLFVGGNVTLSPTTSNSYTGATTLVRSTLTAGNANSPLGSTSGVTVGDGTTLDINGQSLGSLSVTISGDGVDGEGAITNSSSSASIGSLILAADATIGGGEDWSVVDSVDGQQYTLTKRGDSIVVFDDCGATDLGDVLVASGMLVFAESSALNDSDFTATVTAAGTLAFQNNTATNNKKILLDRGTLLAGGTSSQAAVSGQIHVNPLGTIQVDTDAELTLSGKITGLGGVEKLGSGTLVVSSATNDYAGNTTITAGTLAIAGSGVLPSGEGKGDVTVDGTLDLAGHDLTINGLSGEGSVTNNRATVGTNTLTVGRGTFDGTLQDGTNGTLALLKTGAATLTLTGASTYTGDTTVEEGTVAIYAEAGLGDDSADLILDGGTLETRADATLDRPIILGPNGGTINPLGYNCSLDGEILGEGDGGLVVTGGGVLTLGHANSYEGGTTVAAGVLSVSSAGQLGDGGLVFSGGGLKVTGSSSFDFTHNVQLDANATVEVTNTAGVTFSGAIGGAKGFEKLGSGTLALSGPIRPAGDIVVSAGTLDLNALPQTSVLLNGGLIGGTYTPQWWSVTITSGPTQGETTKSLSVDTAYCLSVRQAHVLAPSWQQAVREAVQGSLKVLPSNLIATFSKPGSHGNLGEVIGPFDIGTVSELNLRYENFDLENGYGLSGDDRLIVLDDTMTTSGYGDGDYDDFYLKVQVTESNQSGGSDFGPQKVIPQCGCGSSDGLAAPVHANGQASVTVDYLGGGCATCGNSSGSKTYDNLFAGQSDQGGGFGWQDTEQPRLVQTTDGLIVMFSSRNALWFTADGDNEFSACYGAKETMTHADGVFTLALPDGTLYEFYDFAQTQSIYPRGAFRQMVTPGGETLAAQYYTSGKLYSLTHSTETGEVERRVREYWSSGANKGRLKAETLFRWDADPEVSDWVAVQEADYEYYVDGDAHGLTGDLKSVTRWFIEDEEPVGSGDRHYYQYYIEDFDAQTNPGFQHALKRVLLPNAYEKASALGDVDQLSDEQIANFTCYYYEYDADHRVALERLFGGSQEYELTASTSSAPASENYSTWARKMFEERADGSTQTVYANFVGQVLLTDLEDASNNHWITYHRYDDAGHEILYVEPSGVTGYDEENADLVDYEAQGGSPYLRDTAGLFRVTTYYAATTATQDAQGEPLAAGGIEGWLHQTAVACGETQARRTIGQSGGPDLQSTLDYVAKTIHPQTAETQTAYFLNSSTVYRAEQGSGAITTSFDYTWHADSLQVQQIETTLPAVPGDQNGANVAATRKTYFDASGRLTWQMDERGFLTRHVYDPLTGLLTSTIEDVDTSSIIGEPAGWTTPAGGGLHVETNYSYDLQGRLVQTLGPIHDVVVAGQAVSVRSASWIVYRDAQHETWTAQGFVKESTSGNWNDHTLIGPVSITRTDPDGRVTEQIAAMAETTALGSDPLGTIAGETFTQSEYVRWTVHHYTKTKLDWTRVYYDIAGEDYNETGVAYDSLGRQNKTVTPGGTITRTIFDARGLVTATWVGTDDVPDSGSWSPANNTGANMVCVTSYEYDQDVEGGDGLLTLVTQYVGGGSPDRVTEFGYDGRDRQLWTLQDDGIYQTYTYNYYDNLDRVWQTDRYQDVARDGADSPGGGGDDVLIGRVQTWFDTRGRLFQTDYFGVDMATHEPTIIGLGDETWYDAVGNVIKHQAAGSDAFTKTRYDGLGRATKVYVGYDALGEEIGTTAGYAAALTLDGDTIFEQSEYDYDAAGQTIFATGYQRNHNATGTGALDSSTARASYSASWHDGIGRTVATADWGTNGGVAMDVGDRPDAPLTASTEDVLVTATAYVYTDFDGDGDIDYVVQATDAAGREDWTVLDAAGRTVATIQNYQDGDPETDSDQDGRIADEDVTVLTTYTPDGAVATYTAVNFDPATQTASNQTTTYVYGTDIGGIAPLVYRNDLLRAVVYPDSDDTYDPQTRTFSDNGEYDRVEYQYNIQGQQTQVKDQNGTVHDYIFDALGRQTEDRVSQLGTGIDGAVRRIRMEYDVRGLMEHLTSYDFQRVSSITLNGSTATVTLANHGYATGQTILITGATQLEYNGEFEITKINDNQFSYTVSGSPASPATGSIFASGTVKNDILRQFNDWGLLSKEYQDHDSAVSDPPSGPCVEYLYEDASHPTRRTGIVYPNTRELTYVYDSGDDAALGRVSAILDEDETVLAEYTYLGTGTILGVTYPEPDISYDLAHQTNGQYDYLDRFDRVTSAVWTDGTTDLVHLNYGYDAASNRLWREDAVAASYSKNLDERYWYDGVNQLIDMQRGNLVSGEIENENLSQQWDLDTTGNWSSVTTDSVEQTREHNAANEMTSAENWAAPDYDAVGNMIVIPQPSSPSESFTVTFDAWNRMRLVEDGETVVAEYRYDGLNRRIVKETATLTQHFYLSDQNQVLEERLSTDAFANIQYVWGGRYVDDLVCRDRDMSEIRDGIFDERLYATQDANFNMVSVVDTAGEVQERYTFTAFGVCEIRMDDFDPDGDGLSDFDWRSLYTTREFDPETGLYYLRARYYGAELGRFVGRDPMGYGAGDANLARYVGNRPTGRLDWSGLAEGYVGGECSFVNFNHIDPSMLGPSLDSPPLVNPWPMQAASLQNIRVETTGRENGSGLGWGHPVWPYNTGAGGSYKISENNGAVTVASDSWIWGAGPNGTCNTPIGLFGEELNETAGSFRLYLEHQDVGVYEVAFEYSSLLMNTAHNPGGSHFKIMSPLNNPFGSGERAIERSWDRDKGQTTGIANPQGADTVRVKVNKPGEPVHLLTYEPTLSIQGRDRARNPMMRATTLLTVRSVRRVQ